jgi:hypothetical protein
MNHPLQYRNRPDADGMQTRKMGMAPGGPPTMDESARTVEAIMGTDAPVTVFDWELGRINEVLLMSGAEYPDQLPLLDSHSRWSAGDVLGSVRNIRAESDRLIGTVHFSATKDADDAFTKVREGHLTDFSIGYLVTKSRLVEEGNTEEIDGKEFTGPVKVATRWEIKELSICPIGADKQAKARSEATTPKETAMNKRLREFLEARGLAKDASDEQAWAYLETLKFSTDEPGQEGTRSDSGQAPTPTPAQSAAPAASGIEDERTRAAEIMALGQRHDCLDLAAEAVRTGQDLPAFQSAVLKKLSEQRQESNPGFRAEMGETEQDKFRTAAQDALLFRAGLAEEGADSDLAGYSLREMARECLVRSGGRASGQTMEMIGRALTTSDFPLILANTAHKSLFAGYETADETWARWCATGSVSDFKTHTMVRAGETDDLEEVVENGEYKHGARSEAQEQYSVATYGKLFALSRQTIINDDLSALTDIPFAHGESAARKIGDVVYAVLTANAAMGDGVALFHSDHGNLPTAAALAIASLGAGVAKMKIQTDLSGKRRLNIRPRFLLAPVALELTAEQILTTTVEGTQAKPNLNNPYTGNYFERIYEPRLDDDSAKAWYLAGPKGKTVKVFFLNGVQKPYMETRNGWNVDGVEYKVRLDCGAKAMDWRALLKNAGQ